MLLDFEPQISKQISLLMRFGNSEKTLQRAIHSGHSDDKKHSSMKGGDGRDKSGERIFVNQMHDDLHKLIMDESSLVTLGRLLRFCTREWHWYCIAFLFLCGYSFARILIPMRIGAVVSDLVIAHSREWLNRGLLSLLSLMLINVILSGIREGMVGYANGRVELLHIRAELFRALVSQEIAFYDTTSSGEMISRLTADTQTMADLVATNINILIGYVFVFCGTIFMMISLCWHLVVANLILIPLMVWMDQVFDGRYEKLSELAQDSVASATAVAKQAISAMKTVKCFAGERCEEEDYQSRLDKVLVIKLSLVGSFACFYFTNELTGNCLVLGAVAYGGHLVNSSQLDASSLISFMFYETQMAERLRHKIIEKESAVDVIAGPDAYRDLPYLLSQPSDSGSAVNVVLSADETYADIAPVRNNPDSVTSLISIMRGCDNMCSFCIVPFTRGRERSRPIDSITSEVKSLSEQGVKEVLLLGQNVNSYRDMSESNHYGTPIRESVTSLPHGFRTVYKPKVGGRRFSDLLDAVSQIDPEMRIRFTSPHPKDFPIEVLHLIKDRPNICKHLPLIAESGSNSVLERMNRGYTREAYLDLVNVVREILPDVSLYSDFISGFCGETEEDHLLTLDLIQQVKYSYCYCFSYSMREKTKAHRRLTDDVPLEVKNRRTTELLRTFRSVAQELNRGLIGSRELVLIIKNSRKSSDVHYEGRADGGVKVLVDKTEAFDVKSGVTRIPQPGDYVTVECFFKSVFITKHVPGRAHRYIDEKQAEN